MSSPSPEPTKPYRRLAQRQQAQSPLGWVVPVALALALGGGLLMVIGARRDASPTGEAVEVPAPRRADTDAAPDRTAERARLQRDMNAARTRRGGDAPTPTPTTPLPAPTPAAAGAPPEVGDRGPARVRTVRFAFESGPSALAQAERTARERQRPLLLYFYTDWCGYCRQFEREMLPDPAVIQVLGEQYVGAKLNPESSPAEAAAARQYGIRAFPTLLVVHGGRSERVVALPRGGPSALAQELARAAR